MSDQPNIGPIKADDTLFLQPFPNGGWTVCKRPENPGMMANHLGAYSSAEDMLLALEFALTCPASFNTEKE